MTHKPARLAKALLALLLCALCACGDDDTGSRPTITPPGGLGQDMGSGGQDMDMGADAPDTGALDMADMEPVEEPDMSTDADMTADLGPVDPCADIQHEVYITPNCGPAPLVAQFNAQKALESGGTPLSYQWELSDGTVRQDIAFERTYDTPGDYEEVFRFIMDIEGDRVRGQVVTVVRVLP